MPKLRTSAKEKAKARASNMAIKVDLHPVVIGVVHRITTAMIAHGHKTELGKAKAKASIMNNKPCHQLCPLP